MALEKILMGFDESTLSEILTGGGEFSAAGEWGLPAVLAAYNINQIKNAIKKERDRRIAVHERWGSVPLEALTGARVGGIYSSAAAANVPDIIRRTPTQAGGRMGLEPDDQLHDVPLDEPEEKDELRAERSGRRLPFSKRGVFLGGAGVLTAGLIGLGWTQKTKPDASGNVVVQNDKTGEVKIININSDKSANIPTTASAPTSYGEKKYVGKFKFPKNARYNYVRFNDFAYQAAQNTGVSQTPEPILEKTISHSRAGTGSRIIKLPKQSGNKL